MARTRFTRPTYGNHNVSVSSLRNNLKGLYDESMIALANRTDEQMFWSAVKCHSNRKKKVTLPTLKCLEDDSA